MRITPATDDDLSRIQLAGAIPDDWKYICNAISNGYAFELAIYLYSGLAFRCRDGEIGNLF